MTTQLYALETTGQRRHLATRKSTSATFEAQCQAWTEKNGMPLLVIRESTVKTVKVFYPRGTGIFDTWQARAARERVKHYPFPDDVLTVFEADSTAANEIPSTLPIVLKHEGELTYPFDALPYGARPDCNCRAEVIPYLRTFKNGTKHIYIDCSVCGKTSGAIKRTLLPNAILQALFSDPSR